MNYIAISPESAADAGLDPRWLNALPDGRLIITERQLEALAPKPSDFQILSEDQALALLENPS